MTLVHFSFEGNPYHITLKKHYAANKIGRIEIVHDIPGRGLTRLWLSNPADLPDSTHGGDIVKNVRMLKTIDRSSNPVTSPSRPKILKSKIQTHTHESVENLFNPKSDV